MANGGTGPGAKMFTFLSGLGEGIASIVDPHAQERKKMQEFFLQNPDLLRQFAETQEEMVAEERAQAQEAAPSADEIETGRLQQIADAGAPAQLSERETPNVLAGLSPAFEDLGETMQLLRSAPARTPEQERERRVAEERLEQEEPEATVSAEVAEAGATEAVSEFQRVLAETRDPALAGMAANIKANSEIEMTETQLQSLSRVKDFRADALAGGDMEMVRIIDSVLSGNPQIASAILERKRMSLQERLDQLRLAQDQEEATLERLKLRLDIEDQLEEGRDRVRNLLQEQPEGWEEQMEEEVAALNRTRQAVRRHIPETTSFFTSLTKGWLGGLGIEVEEVPVITDDEQLQSTLSEITKQAASNPDVTERELFQSKGFQSLMAALPSGDPRRTQIRQYLQNVIRQKQQNLDVDQETGNPVYVIPPGMPGAGTVGEIPVEEAMQMTQEFFDVMGQHVTEFFEARQGPSPRTRLQQRGGGQ